MKSNHPRTVREDAATQEEDPYWVTVGRNSVSLACLFYPLGENRRFERVEENIAVGSEVFRVQVYPRHEFKLEPVDNSLSDINFFRVESIDNTTVSIKVAKSLEDLVDR
ncbi:hypothetical protein AVEN_86-1, partial [Araneus ventricosus]